MGQVVGTLQCLPMHWPKRVPALAAGGLLSLMLHGPAQASAVTFTGRLDDSADTLHLVGSQGLTAPQFGSDYDIANNVALWTFNVATSGLIAISSTSYSAGGIDAYLTVFLGTGNDATYVGSGISVDGLEDFNFALSLLAGDYTLAIGTFANQSFADNSGGTLADGFIGLGEPGSLGSSAYVVSVSTDVVVNPVPEPDAASLAFIALGVAAWGTSRRRRSPP